MKYNNVVLFSGGIDSLCTIMYLNKKCKCIYVDMGHLYAKKELECVKRISCRLSLDLEVCRDIRIGRLEQEDAYIPLRNLYLAMLGTNFSYNVWMGATHGERVADKSPAAFRLMSKTLSSLLGKDVKICSPFHKITKTELIRWYLNNNFSKELLYQSVSCYSKELGSCGKCPSCFRKWVAFINNSLDVAFFKNDPYKWEGIDGYIDRINKKLYTKKRSKEVIDALHTAYRYYQVI